MKINVYGFKFTKTELPPAMKATDVFARMEREPGMKIGKTYRYGAHKLTANIGEVESEWWGGIILKVRDSKAFTKLTEGEGKMVLTAETLAANEKLVELTYFIAHPDTGSGLLAQHYHGTSITAFGLACSKVFKTAQREAAEEATKEKSPKEKSAILKQFRGKLALEQLSHDTDLRALVKKLKRVASFELKLATLETRETFLRGIIEKASHETLKLTFPLDASVDELADDAAALVEAGAVNDVKVIGYDGQNIKREYYKDQNPLVFEVFDYDQVMVGLKIDFSNWAESIENSVMIKQLIAVASHKSTHKLLTTA
jgi:hypothetical protein